MRSLTTFFATLLTLGAAGTAHTATLRVNPVLPAYGQPVTVELTDTNSATYLRATRYSKAGNTITVEFEYLPASFGPLGPDFGIGALRLGELAPGNYTIEARLFNIASPKSSPETMSRQVAVVPPDAWGLHLVPKEPDAFAPFEVVVRSAVYFDPQTLKARVDGGLVRVDFDYMGNAPAGGTAPAGMTTFAAVRVPALAPGTYRIEGWGRDRSSATAAPERYFERALSVPGAVPIVEYYSVALDHYFMAAGPDEVALVDSGARGDWKRTGQTFNAWLRAADASPMARPVCRFYASGPNSHFFTGDAKECEFLKSLEQTQRAEANARGQPFLGWAYEGIAFYAVIPEAGACAGGLAPVYRAYNNRWKENDSNHRFMRDAQQRTAMAVSWVDEGPAFCSAP